MTRPGTDASQREMVDEGWGRKAADFASLSEPGNCREYVAIQNVGEAEFLRAAVEQAQINVVGYLARKPEGAASP